MKKPQLTKNNLITIVLVVIYLLVLLRFGMPFPKRELIRGTTYRAAARESQFLWKLYVVRKPFRIVGKIGIPFLLGLTMFQHHLLNLATAFGMTKLAKKAVGLTLAVCCIITAAGLILAALNLIITNTSQGEALKEYSRVEFLWMLAIAFVVFVGIEYFLRFFLYFKNLERSN